MDPYRFTATLERRFGGVEDMHLLKGYSSSDDLVNALHVSVCCQGTSPLSSDALELAEYWSNPMPAPENSPNDVPPPAKTIPELAHDLSNALEIIMQSSFLLGTLDLGENGRQWHQLLEGGVAKATTINRQLREAVRSEAAETRSESC